MNDMIDNESTISLFDLWRIISKHKWIFWSVFLVVIVAGLIFALLTPHTYRYSQSFQAAHYVNNGKVIPVQDEKALDSAIFNMYLPDVINRYNDRHPNAPIYLGLNFSIGFAGADVINLYIKGVEKQKAAYREIFQGILQQVNVGIAPLLQIQKDFINTQLANAQKRLAERIGNSKILTQTIEESNQTTTDTTTLSSAQISSGLKLVFKQQLLNMNEQEQDAITNLINQISNLQVELKTLQQGRFITEVVRSPRPVGTSRANLIMLFGILGIVLGFVGVFVREFFVKVRQVDKSE